MELRKINAGVKTPEVDLNADEGILMISGKSIPENAVEFYKPVFEWIENYSAKPKEKTEIKIQLEYFNTSSSKCLLDIFRKFEALHNSGKSVVGITWLYEEDDEDMKEAGEDYQTIVKLPIRFEIV